MTLKFDPEAIGFLISDVARLLRAEFDRRTSSAGLGLTPGEARILVAAARAGPVRQAVLAERVGIEAMTLSSYLDRLEGQGLVSRTADPNDRRAKVVEVTEPADAVLAGIGLVSEKLRNDMSQSLSPGRLEEVRQGLKQIRVSLHGMKPDCGKNNPE